VLGGEASGHMIFLNRHTTGDGMISALQLLAAMRNVQQPLSALARILTPAPQQIVNIAVRQKPPLADLPALQQALRAAEAELGDRGRVLIRYSGTQAVCRVMVEGPTEDLTQRLARSLAEVVRAGLG